MISDQPREEIEVDRQIISMLYDAIVVETISSGNYWDIFHGDDNKHSLFIVEMSTTHRSMKFLGVVKYTVCFFRS